MAKIGTKNGSNGRERDFVKRAGEGQGQECDGKCHDAAQRVERAKREERLDVPHADAGGLTEVPPERLSEHKGKVDDDRKTGVVKRRINTFVEPNAC